VILTDQQPLSLFIYSKNIAAKLKGLLLTQANLLLSILLADVVSEKNYFFYK